MTKSDLLERVKWVAKEEIVCSCDEDCLISPCTCHNDAARAMLEEVAKWVESLPKNMTAERVARHFRSMCEEDTDGNES